MSESEQEKRPRPKRPRKRSKSSRKGQSKPANNNQPPPYKPPQTAYEHVRESFVACHECSLFFAGLEVRVGREPLKKLLRTGDRKWLTLQWNDEMEHLLGRSYSFFMYGDGIKNEGQCSCCQRTIVVELEKLDADGDVVADFEPAVLVERMVAQRPKQNSR